MEYLDLVKNIIRISPDKKVKESEDFEQGFMKKDEYNFYIGFDFEFKI